MIAEKNPFRLFRNWYDEAHKAGIAEPGMMSLATVGPGGRPSARMVLFKEVSERGFVFFTNYKSRKAGEIDQNSYVSAVIYWELLGYQVRIEGKIEKIPSQESDNYFSTRPRGSQLSAWGSPQSREIPSGNYLIKEMVRYDKMYNGGTVPRPPYWGGYMLIPDRYEFWKEGVHWNSSILAP